MPGRRAIAWLAVALALAVGPIEAAEIAVGREATVRSVDGVNLRASPSTDAEVLTIAEGGDFVQVLATQGEWAKVEYDGAVGWAHTRYLGPARDRGEVSTRGRRPGAVVTESGVRLPVPYRTQLDGSPYQGANCGPTSIAMALQAFGKYVPTTDIRRAANRMQGTTGWYDAGTALETLTEIVSQQGLVPRGLFARDGGGQARGYDRWSMDDVRQALRNGHIFIPQVHLATLPGQEHSSRAIDHFIVIIGYYDDVFIYHDPAFNGNGGHSLQISEERLTLAWKRGDYPFAGFSVGPGEGMEPLLEPAAPPVQIAAAPPVSPPPLVPDRELAREQLRRYFEAEPPTTLAVVATPPAEVAVAPPAPTPEPVVAVAAAESSSPVMPRVIAPDPAWPALLAAVLGLALLGSRRVLSVREATLR